MAKSIKESLRENLQDLVEARIPTEFTNKRLKELGVEIPSIQISPTKITRKRRAV